MEKARGEVEARCELCCEAKAKAFCRQCAVFICDECMKSHQRMKTFDGYETVTLEQLKNGGTKNIPIKKLPRSTCKLHEEEMKIYCFDCNHLICRDCIVFDDSC